MKYELQHYQDAALEPMPEHVRFRMMAGRCSINGIDCNWVHIAYRNGDYIRVPVPSTTIVDPANDNIEKGFNRLLAAAY